MFNYSKTQSHLFACNYQFSGLPSVVSSDEEDSVLVKNAISEIECRETHLY